MPYRLTPNVPVHAQLRFCDVVSSQYGPQVKVKAVIDGREEHVYLPGAATDAIGVLLSAGVIAAPPDSFPALGDTRGIALKLCKRDVVITLEKAAPRAAGRLTVRTNGATPQTREPAPAPPSPSPTPATPAESVAVKRAAIVQAFGAALDVVISEYLPRFAAQDIAMSDAVLYRCANAVFVAWREAGCA